MKIFKNKNNLEKKETSFEKKGIFSSLKKIFTGTLFGFIFIFTVFSVILFPSKTQAQAFVSVYDIQVWQELAREFVRQQANQSLKDSVYFAANEALSQMLNTMAYDVANWIATGDEGQQPLFYTEGWGDYLANIADGAAGQFLDEIGQDWLDLNVCNPSTINLKISLGLGIAEQHRPSQPVCRFTDIVNNFSNIADEDFLENFEFVFDPSQNDLGIAWTILGKHDEFIAAEIEAGEKDREEGDGIKGVLSKISNTINTPSQFVLGFEKSFTDLTLKEKQDDIQYGPIVATAIDTFVSTLAGKMFQKLFKQGFVSDGGSSSGCFGCGFFNNPDNDLFNPQGQPTRVADERFLDFLETGSGNAAPFDILSRLSTCINPENPGPDDCVISSGFRSAIEQRLTLREAIARGLIDGGAPFGSFSYSPDSIYEGIPYRSILILRAHSIVPVGWELAAEAIKQYDDPEQVFGLNDLIAQYDNPNSRYYGLIDDQWVLKAPAHLCRAEGFGPQVLFEDVLPGVDNNGDGDFNDNGDQRPQPQVARAQYCADYQTCIEKAPDGSCRYYGYCIEERRTWNLQGQSCDELYNTCQTFQNTATGQVASYLQNSLDFDGCNADNAGCQWYCQSYNALSDIWTCTATDERVLKECETPGGCTVNTTCNVAEGGDSCNDSTAGVDLALSSPCSPGSRWWDDGLNRCVVSASCTIPENGVNCQINSCDALANLLPNPDFETTSAPGTLAANWNGNLEYFDQVIGATEKVLSGQRSIRFFSFGGRVDGNLVAQSDPVDLPSGNYTFISNAFDNLNRGNVTIQLVEPSSGQVKFSKQTTLTNRWQELSGDFVVGADEQVVVRIVVSPGAGQIISGSAWFDDFRISNSCIVDEITLTLVGTESVNESKLHFDNDVEACDPGSAGCSAFIRTLPNLGTNLVRNSSFENWPNPNDYPPGWQDGEGDGITAIEQVQDSVIGAYSLKVFNNIQESTNDGREVSTTIIPEIKANTTYRVSFWAKSDQNISVDDELWVAELSSEHDPDWYCSNNSALLCNTDDDCGGANTCIRDFDRPLYQGSIFLPLTTEWQRYVLDPVTTRSPGSDFQLTFSNISDDNRPIYVDGVQVEEVSTVNPVVSPYKDYGQANLVNLRKPPKYLNCQGLPTDPAECGDYAYVCQESEVGCEAYTPVNGGPAIPGVVSPTDYCPLECAGYDAYKQSTTFFESQEALEFFIPSTARSCSASQVGCTEFTNLDEVAAGGEGLEYYQALRLCQLPDDPASTCTTFFTWQGSDDAGFQLKVHSLAGEEADIDGDGDIETVPTAAITDVNQLPDAWCNNKGDSNGDGLPDCCDASEDVLANPFCREYISAEGDVSYQLADNTISCSNDCHPFRKTNLGVDPVDAKNNCDNSSGTWDEDNQTCIYLAIPDQGIQCSAQAASCREYVGNSGNNELTVFYEDFEAGNADGYRYGLISSEALNVGGHSIVAQRRVNDTNHRIVNSVAYLGTRVNASTMNYSVCNDSLPECDESTTFNCYDSETSKCLARDEADASFICEVNIGETFCGAINDVLTEDKVYSVSFWAKSAGPNINNAFLEVVSNFTQYSGGAINVGGFNLTSEWRHYTFDPFVYDSEIMTPAARFRFMGPVYATAADAERDSVEFFVDNIEIKEIRDRAYVIRNSWQTPVSCDTNPYTNPPTEAPQYMLGCDQYTDSFGRVHNLKSFEQLCREEAVGCEALIDTHNSASPFAQVFNAGDANSDITIPADNLTYLTNRTEFRCSEDALGCVAVGVPFLDIEGQVTGYQTDYLVNNPDQYETILCSSGEVACEEYTTEEGTAYFKDPRGRECEYRNRSISANPGWYIIGSVSDTPNCPLIESPVGQPHPQLLDGVGYVGLCPAAQSTCTQFIDPISEIAKNEIFNGDLTPGVYQETANPPIPDGWIRFSGENVTQVTTDPVTGSQVPSTTGLHTRVQLKANTVYTFASEFRRIGNEGVIAVQLDECQGITSFDNSATLSDGFFTDENGRDDRYPSGTPEEERDGLFDIARIDRESEDLTKYSARIKTSDIDLSCRVTVFTNFEFEGDPNNPDVETDEDFIARMLGTATDPNITYIALRETDVSYALKSSVDFLSCNGIVDPENGCVLFNDRSGVNYKFGEQDNSYLLFDSDLTEAGGVPEADCVGGCDSNAVLRVRPDRECGEWLSCASNIVRTSPDGSQKNVCLSVVACSLLNENGECERQRLYEPAGNQVFQIPAQAEQLKNISGFSKVGLEWGNFPTQSLEGYYPYDQMTEVGEGSDLINGNFEQAFPGTSQPVGWRSGDLDLTASTTIWEPFRFSLASDPRFIKEGGSYLQLNADHKAVSEVIDIVNINEDDPTSTSSGMYTISGLVNTLNLNPPSSSSSAKILIQANGNGDTNTINLNLVQANTGSGCFRMSSPRFAGWVECPKLTVNAGLPWQEVIQELNVPDSVTRLQLMLTNYHTDERCLNVNEEDVCVLSGNSLFDNISLKPVLQTSVDDNDQPRLLTRSCRLYPEQDSLSCEYIRNDRLFVGQNGYCLLKDPANPNICLQWWPIDQLRGEIIDELSGYDGRVPLYQCLEGNLKNDYTYYFEPNGNTIECNGTCRTYVMDETIVTFAACAYWREGGQDDDSTYSFGYNDENGNSQVYPAIRPSLPGQTGHNTRDWIGCVASGRFQIPDLEVDLDPNDSRPPLVNPIIDWFNANNDGLGTDHVQIVPDVTEYTIRALCGGGDSGGCDYVPRAIVGFGFENVWGECTQITRTVSDSGVNKNWNSRVNLGSDYRLEILNYPYETFVEPFGSLPSYLGTPIEWNSGIFDSGGVLPLRFANFNLTEEQQEPFYTGRGIPYKLNNNLLDNIKPYVGQCSVSKAICMISPDSTKVEIPGCPVVGETCNLNTVIPSANNPIFVAQNIFARSYGIWNWNNSASVRRYQLTNQSWNPPPVECTIGGSVILNRPSPDSPEHNQLNNGGYCFIRPRVSATLSSQGIVGADTVRLDFNAIVDPDQLPLKFYRVDWGNGVVDSVSGVSLRNRFNPENPFTLYHRYDYWQLRSFDEQPGNNIDCAGNSCTVTIEIKIVDNWDKPSVLNEDSQLELQVFQPTSF